MTDFNKLESSIASRSKAVKQLLLRYGTTKPPSAKTVMLMYQVAGEPFLVDFFRTINKNNILNADGPLTDSQRGSEYSASDRQRAKALADVSTEKQNFSKFKNWFNTALSSLGNFGENIQNIASAGQKVKDIVDPNSEANKNYQEDLAKETAKENKGWKMYLAIGAIIILVLGLIVIVVKKS